LINESVYTSDDIDIGDIDAVSRIFVVVKRGFVNTHYYYIPLTKVEGWDGNVLWLTIPEEKVVTKYEMEDPPDPLRYYVKDYPNYFTGYYPELAIIPPRFAMPSYSYATTTTHAASRAGTQQSAREDTQPLFICDLCSRSDFKSEDILADHVNAFH
jgi:hypothetical protein